MMYSYRLIRELNRFLKDSSGASAVEAAICFPIVLTLMFGCFQYGLFFNKTTELNHSFQEASREIKLLDNPSNSELKALFSSKISAKDQDNVTLTVNRVNRYGESFASIDMTYNYTIDIPLIEKYPLTSSYQNLVMLSDET